MKIVLIQPPVQDFYETGVRLQPLGLACLKAAVKKYLPHHSVVLKDFHQGYGRRTVPLPRDLADLRDFYPVRDQSPFSTFHEYYHFGASYETVAEEAAAESPDLVGISSLFSPYYREVLACAKAIKKRSRVPVLLGGPHVSACPELMLEDPDVDFVIRGEGERPLVELLRALEAGSNLAAVPNLGYKANGKILLNPLADNFSLTDLPAPDFTGLSPERYLYEKTPMAFLLTSRGCPHHCSFCSVHQTFGGTYRRRRVSDVLEEMRARYGQGYRVFDFEDDHLTYQKDDLKELCAGIAREFEGKPVRLLAMNGISYLSLDAELLGLMRRAGWTHLNLSFVSSDASVLEAVRRPYQAERYREIVLEAHRFGLKIVSYQILGLPGESLDSQIETLVFQARLPVLLGASPFYLTPQTPLAGRFPPRTPAEIFRARLTAMGIETPEFSREDIYTLFVTTRILNFLKSLAFEEPSLNLAEALTRFRRRDRRSQSGAEILERLLAGGRLDALNRTGRHPLKKFRPELFRKVWDAAGEIRTQEGKKIVWSRGE